MRRIAITLALLFCSALASAQRVQPLIQWYTKAGVQACTYQQNVVSGDPLIVGASTFGSLTGISDALGSSWTLVDSSTAGGVISRVWVASAASSGADTVTVTGTLSFNQISCSEWDKKLYTTTVDVHTNGSFSGSPSSFTMSSVTTTVNGDLYYAFTGGFNDAGEFSPEAPLLIVSAVHGSDSEAAGYKITDTNGAYSGKFLVRSNSQGNYVVITLKPVAMAIVTSTLPTATTSNSYSYQLQALNGAGAYTWSISSGSLPSGLSINSSTGVISGTPTTGTSTFTAQVTDGTTTATKSLTLTVNSTASTPTYVETTANSNPNLGSLQAGDVILVTYYYTDTNGAVYYGIPPTDTLGTPFTLLSSVTALLNLSPAYFMQAWIGVVPTTGTDTALTASGRSDIGYLTTVLRGVQGTADAWVGTNGTSAAASTHTSASLTTPAPNSMVLVADEPYTNSAFTAGTGYTLSSTGYSSLCANCEIMHEYKVQASAGAVTPSFSVTGNTGLEWVLGALALRPSTSGTVASGSARHGAKIAF